MTTLLYSHPVCQQHDMGAYHPECPDRLRAILAALEDDAFDALERREAPLADPAWLERNHAAGYVEAIFENMPSSGTVQLDPDTALSPQSGEAALRAVGGLCDGVDQVIGGKVSNAFCAVRPPGHHAESSQAMGFCLFNNVAVAAQYARAEHGLERIAVVDFDVHHGNGTQHAFEADANLFYASSHQSPCYPGTGRESETGVANNIVNQILAPGEGSVPFRKAYENVILPELEKFKPELLLISAGFDAHDRDPLAQLCLQDDDFAWVTRQLLGVADQCCEGRVVSTLEGGYDLDALASSVSAHVGELMRG